MTLPPSHPSERTHSNLVSAVAPPLSSVLPPFDQFSSSLISSGSYHFLKDHISLNIWATPPSLLFLLSNPVNKECIWHLPCARYHGSRHCTYTSGQCRHWPCFWSTFSPVAEKDKQTNSHYSDDTGECHGKGTGSGKNRVQTLALPLTKYMGLSWSQYISMP